jgi:thiosulfate/3-mercaptopyruvate sulfurtransferase
MPIDPIVCASELARLQSASELVLLDCRPEPSAYAAGHLRGARHADLERDLSAARAPGADPARGGRHPLPSAREFAARLGSWGITPQSRVVAYDDQGGANAAARLWWMLKALGHARVHVVDGGLAALRAHGFELTAEIAPTEAAPPYPASHYGSPMAQLEDVKQALRGSSDRVLDVRAAARFCGESEPIDPIAGHIPGALNLPFSENMEASGRFKSGAELRALYEPLLAGAAAAQLIVHCGSGVTACHTLLALERAGLTGARLYVGSWSEWCRDRGLPIATQP